MDKLKRVKKDKTEEGIQENEVRVTAQGQLRNYVSYVVSQFTEKVRDMEGTVLSVYLSSFIFPLRSGF